MPSSLCLRARILKAVVSVHPESVRQESIFLISGELPGSGLATEGTANSETQFGASRRKRAARGWDEDFDPQSCKMSS